MTRKNSRRTFLKTAAVAGAVGIVSTRGQAQESTFDLGGDTGGWIGRSPESIAEERNPTLELEPGETYEIVWENVDGARHNVVILGEGQERLVRTEIIAEEGATQSVEFEATEDMTEYLCEVHPETMIGDIEVGEADAEQEETPTETTTPEDGAETETTTEQETDEEETEVPEVREPQAVEEETPAVDSEVNEDAVAQFQGETTTEEGGTEVPEAREPEEAEQGMPEAAPEVRGEGFDPDQINVNVIVGGENETETEQGLRGRPSSGRSGLGALSVIGGLTSAGAFILARDGDDEE